MKKKTRLILLRTALGVLILANMLAIFLFSAQTGEESGKTSGKVTYTVAEITVEDFTSKPIVEQTRILEKLHHPIRKIAHMLEFGSLGALTFLFLLTWKDALLLRYVGSLVTTFLYACSDEWHQQISEGRGPRFSDVLIDLCGALITCSVILLICLWIKNKRKKKATHMKTTRYHIDTDRDDLHLRVAVASDLHGCPHGAIIEALKNETPDMILIPGDLMDDKDLRQENNRGYEFLRAAAAIAPTYYSLGNHELACYHKGNPWRHPIPVPLTDQIRDRIRKTGAILLDNDSTVHGDLRVCGLTSGINGKINRPDTDALQAFANAPEYRILLCHHPEYFMPYVKSTDIELTVSGHAHGGHWRFFGRGVYAPGQGLFPKYTSGVLENRCVISRGLANHTSIPRICNPTELVIIEIGKTK